ncbi:phosphoglycolate phosphatase [Roseicitreum antarcticum]|uniref:Phosphoglycolate phosphatase n=1 Tax=Roseicitreum antarcticum TaxID=564137 RepID=A0A1H2QYT7_9RHOB|nr:phosphoglycolate phosphatase [Roseicitreum antarcticum]SDW11609.1 phosphoglycolate phosphatase [Roseicitreum antarcticum]
MSAIVFDLDGTLVHSAPDIAAAANRMLQEAGHPPLDMATAITFVGKGIPHFVGQVMAHYGIDPAQHAALTARMVAHYTAHPADLTRPYPGVVATLEVLTAQGHALGICTNKFHAQSVQILDALDLSRFFGVVIGGDSLPVKKPDPAPMHAAFAALPGAPLLYVGDSETDAETARRAGQRFALFTEGYRQAPVAELPHAFAFGDFATLPDFVDGLA